MGRLRDSAAFLWLVSIAVAGRPPRPAVERDSPSALAAFRIGALQVLAALLVPYGGVKRHTRILRVAVMSLWSAAIAAQAVVPGMTATLLDHIKRERFAIITSIRGLPLGVRDRLQTLFGSSTLEIAEPGEEFQVTDVIAKPKLPIRRLVAAGCTTANYCLVYYERGGVAHSWHVAMFHWTPAATRFEWGGMAPGGLATIDEVRSAILAGAIKGAPGFW